MARILLVDDEEGILRVTGVLLESEGGHSTVSVINGLEAQRVLASEEFDVVVTDLQMEPVNGMELMQSLRERKNTVPIVVMTAYGSEKTEEEAKELGACFYLKKPFQLEDLLAAIDRAVGKKT